MENKTYQITQFFANQSFGYLYFELPTGASEEDIKTKALEVQRADRKKRANSGLYLFGAPMERPTILIMEWESGSIVKKGINLKIKWR
ncbi:hypothetical protein FAZ19_19810 [Sphingobacterium alkalisoli]|uniref:Uncharacterized protein n=1 Tax=Sphingobacterium alkalisoli TaxID=1874115 RepID=A0A4U0GUQ2_9SPHI|nr:hypothetical protein [Sphingobacterium alkalisoli]TJY62717.1 hypothetical protein FAZ19_19810 [Sphingobacterium alkalisoli]GGH28404.1 hypothetical protein GCM10011418_39050 [Sphingobacterium alkalisoli]